MNRKGCRDKSLGVLVLFFSLASLGCGAHTMVSEAPKQRATLVKKHSSDAVTPGYSEFNFRVCLLAEMVEPIDFSIQTLETKKSVYEGQLEPRNQGVKKHVFELIQEESGIQTYSLTPANDNIPSSLVYCKNIDGWKNEPNDYVIIFKFGTPTKTAALEFVIDKADIGVEIEMVLVPNEGKSDFLSLIARNIRESSDVVTVERNWVEFFPLSEEKCFKYKVNNSGKKDIYGTVVRFFTTKLGTDLEYRVNNIWKKEFISESFCVDDDLFRNRISDVLRNGDGKETVCNCPHRTIEQVRKKDGAAIKQVRFYLDYSYDNEAELWLEAHKQVQDGHQKFITYTTTVYRYFDAPIEAF